jgi:tetratricopeptide (TPR) repeat protein
LSKDTNNGFKSSSIDIQSNEGDVIGVGIDGNGNIIGKDINIVINQAYDYGINLLSSSYFENYKSTNQDTEDWKNGFSFKLESIKEKKEFRRPILSDIKNQLEKEHRLLIVGESGTSKTTILMEVICDYFDLGYKILYNFGDQEFKNINDLVNFIEDLLKGGNKVLVAIDNVHSERTAPIFYIMDHFSNYRLNDNLLFIITARLPEFDWFTNDRLNKIDEIYRQPIIKFIQQPELQYELGAFTKEDIEEFIKMYETPVVTSLNDTTKYIALKIFDETKGNPILVKFHVLGKGLKEDVRDRYYRYLDNDSSGSSSLANTKTMLVGSLLDIANLPITDQLLENLELIESAYSLENAILYRNTNGIWKTIHPKWDMELLSFLYDQKNKGILFRRKEILKSTLNSLFDLCDERISTAIIQTVYDMVSLNIISIDVVESTTSLPDYLDNKTKSYLYLFTIATTYRLLRIYPKMIFFGQKALLLDPNDTDTLNANALFLSSTMQYDQALEYCNKIITLESTDIGAWTNKGLALYGLKRYDEALECWKKAVEIDDNYVNYWNSLQHRLSNLNDYGKSKLNHLIAIKLIGKSSSYCFLKRYDEALECCDKALRLYPVEDVYYSTTRAWALNGMKRSNEALECSNKAIELESANDLSQSNRAWALNGLKRYDEALECSNKAIELESSNAWAWVNKSWALNGLKRYDEALECSNKAIELDSNNIPPAFMEFSGFLRNNLS